MSLAFILSRNGTVSPRRAKERARFLADFAVTTKGLATQCGILLPVFRALVFGLALCFWESINLT
jgi:hypothetical protein